MREPLAFAAEQDANLTDTVVIDEDLSPRFAVTPTHREQRQSYRYPAQAGCDDATLRRGQRTTACKLTEESAGGVALLVPKDFRVDVDDEVQVELYSGWYRARVVHVQPGEQGNRLGLQRIAAISADTSDDRPARRSGKGETSGGAKRMLVTLVLAGAAMLAGGGIMNWILRGAVGFGSSQPQPQVGANIGGPSRGGQFAGILESVNMLNVPEVAKEMRLSREQQTTLQGIFVGTSNRLSTLHEETKNQPPEVWYRQSQTVVNEALGNILCSLTDDQIAQWRQILLSKRQSQAEDT